MLQRKDKGEELGYTKDKVSRKGLKITCSICGIVGHNKRFHGSQVHDAHLTKTFCIFLIHVCLTCIYHRVYLAALVGHQITMR